MRKHFVFVIVAAFFMLTGCALRGYEDYGDTASYADISAEAAASAEESSDNYEPETSIGNAQEEDEDGGEEKIVHPSGSFEALVDGNPLDADYEKEAADAENNSESVRINDKYAQMWLDEVGNAYSILMQDATEEVQQNVMRSQQAWEEGRENKVESILNEANETGGSIGQLTGSANVLAYYRERALELYRMVYDREGIVPFYYLK